MNKLKIDKNIEGSWLRNVPEGWRIERLKDLGPLQNGVSKGKEYFGSGNPFVSYGNVYNDSIELNRIKKLANSNKGEQKQYSVVEGDIFFTRTSETIDEIGISATAMETIPKATFSGFVIRLRPKKFKIEKGFSKYYFQSVLNRQLLSKEINLVTRASLSQGILNNTPVLLPPKEVQQKIARYLNIRTQAIDKKIKLLQEKIAIYKEYRNSLINETVTKGLNKKVSLKDSGIEWIGEIPMHWKVSRIKDNCNSITGNSISDKSQYENVEDSISYIATKDINIENNSIHYDNGIYIPKKDKNFKISKRNSTLLCLEGANAGKKVAFSNRNIAFVNKLASIKSSSKDLDDKYLFYVIQSGLFKNQFFAEMSGLIGGVSLGIIRYFNIIIPPKKDQIEIVEFLDLKTETINKIVDNIKKQIKTLKELRKTLINDVVTGKIKVTG